MSSGAIADILHKYKNHLEKFLLTEAKYDIDRDGKLWCSKKDWYSFLRPLINDDDGNAIGHRYCITNVKNIPKTASKMLKLINRGKDYIGHRMYNQILSGKIEKRKTKNRVSHFRLLEDKEKPTVPVPDNIFILKKIFKEAQVTQNEDDTKTYILTVDEASELF